MILTDAGPLIAIFVRRDPHHARCVSMLDTIALPLVTTWPAFTEAMYMVGAAGGWNGQVGLWRLVERGDLLIVDISTDAASRIRMLMEQYRDLPMDLADASLVAVAEERRLTRIFTLDSDFRVYRLPRRQRFDIVP
jgi:predicted nucleic acid-binding protein